MIIKYTNFINENKIKKNILKERLSITYKELILLKKYDIIAYEFNQETNLIDVLQDIDLSNNDLTILPEIRFGIIDGNFHCHNNRLTTLENCPKEVYGSFYCQNNKLTSLEHCITKIDGDFDCANNLLTNLMYCPRIIYGQLHCADNKLTSLEYLPKIINRGLYCANNPLTIEDYPITTKIKRWISTDYSFQEIYNIVKEHKEIFDQILDDKIKFHQMIMRINPSLIQYYKTIPVPKNKSSLLL